jgi:hypothetical protein
MATNLDDARAAKREASTQYLAPVPDVPQFAALTMAGIAANAMPLLNVHAVGVGLKTVAGIPDAVLAVRFYVLRKVPKAMLSPGQMLPDSIAGVPTDVIQSAPAHFAATLGQRLQMRPVRAGASIAHRMIGAGTLGAICRRDPDDGRRFALSNNHVLSNLGRAAVGDEIVQPSPLDADADAPGGVVARLAAFEPIRTDGTRNQVDAALAEFLPGAGSNVSDIIDVGVAGPPAAAAVGTRVVKSGRTTGVTRGVVADVEYDLQLPLQSLGLTGSALFEDTIRIEASDGVVGNPGDSGALFLTDDGSLCPVALLFATGGGGGYAVACKLDLALQRMGVVIA